MIEGTLLRAFLTLILMVGCFAGFFFILKKFIHKNKKFGCDVDLKVISKIPLQQKTFAYVVKAGSKTLLIGSNDHSISTLADLSEVEELPAGEDFKAIPHRLPQPARKIRPIPVEKDLSFGTFLKSTFRKQVG